jgi:hypothetical protein
MMLKQATVETTVGVRQGAPTSGFLFTLLVNDLIRRFKQESPMDDFLGNLHCLMMMDDTVILSTSREKAIQKIAILNEFCRLSGMQINGKKTLFMAVNGTPEDRTPLQCQDLTIENYASYTQLGAMYTQDAKLTTSMKAHCEAKWSHVLKFNAFIAKNTDMPYCAKKKVFTSALSAAILYGNEAWLSDAQPKSPNQCMPAASGRYWASGERLQQTSA